MLSTARGLGLWAFALAASGCPGAPLIDMKSSLPPGFEVRLDHVSYRKFDRLGVLADATTPRAWLSPTNGLIRFRAIEVKQRSSASMGGSVEINAMGGSADLVTGAMNLQNSVRIADGAGRTLSAPAAAYDPVDQILSGPGPASLTGPNYDLSAETGFVVDVRAGVVDLQGPIAVHVESLQLVERDRGRPGSRPKDRPN